MFGIASARLAQRQERRESLWFLFGAILGPIALALLYSAPPGVCRSCMFPTRGWLTVCAWCHEDVRVTPLEKMALLAKLTRASAEGDRARARDQARPVERASQVPPAVLPSGPSGGGPRFGGVIARVAPNRSPTAVARQGSVTKPVPVATATGTAAAGGRRPIQSGPLATATYIAGSTSLTPGGRYVFSIDGARLRLLGPVEVDPSTVALECNVAELDASVIEARLLVSRQHGRSESILAFMLVSGMTPESLAAAIVEAARMAGRA